MTAIGHSERVDIYWTTLIERLSRAVAKTNKMSFYESELAIIGRDADLFAAQLIALGYDPDPPCLSSRAATTE
jgi:hypothetical protein